MAGAGPWYVVSPPYCCVWLPRAEALALTRACVVGGNGTGDIDIVSPSMSDPRGESQPRHSYSGECTGSSRRVLCCTGPGAVVCGLTLSLAHTTAPVGVSNQRLGKAAYQSATEGHFTLTLGGDHCVAIGSLGCVSPGRSVAAVVRAGGGLRSCRCVAYLSCRSGALKARPSLGVVWVDAHADINAPEFSPSANAHGMPVAFLTRLVEYVGTHALRHARRADTRPALHPHAAGRPKSPDTSGWTPCRRLTHRRCVVGGVATRCAVIRRGSTRVLPSPGAVAARTRADRVRWPARLGRVREGSHSQAGHQDVHHAGACVPWAWAWVLVRVCVGVRVWVLCVCVGRAAAPCLLPRPCLHRACMTRVRSDARITRSTSTSTASAR